MHYQTRPDSIGIVAFRLNFNQWRKKMNTTQHLVHLQSYRSDLLRRQKEYQTAIFSEESKMIVGAGMEDGDRSTREHLNRMSLLQLDSISRTINTIDRALQMIEAGTYGICNECDEEIDGQRLHSLPFAILCFDCQKKADTGRRQATEKCAA